jgi:CheY-like chemotaxis protein
VSALHEQAKETSRKKHVLLVDADVAVRDALASALCSENYSVVSAGDQHEAVDSLVRHPIDVALVDLDGPGKGAWDAVRRLDAADPRLPIVLLTAQPDLIAYPWAGRAHACFQKPLLDMQALMGTLSTLTA